jgi:hypothetical protein
VAYLNGSKVLTTGSALTFDGSRIALSTATSNIQLTTTVNTNQAYISLADADGRTAVFRGPNSGSPNCAQIGTTTNHDTAFLYGNTEQMRLTSTGLGIGTSSVSDKLTLGSGRMKINTGGLALYVGNDGTDNALQLVSGTTIKFQSGSGYATNMLLDSSGNLGLGVTPSAWNSSWKAIDLGSGAAVSGRSDNSGIAYMQANSYRGASNWIYKTSGTAAALYAQDTGLHIWYTAPSGTAGNAITFTQAMTLDASGRLVVGATSTAAKFQVSGASANTYLLIDNAGAGENYFAANSANIFQTAGAERARIDSSGNLLIGATSRFSTERVSINQTVAGAQALYTKNLSGDFNFNCWNAATSGDNQFIQFITEASPTSRGSITYNRGAGLVAYNVTSDYRAKDILGPVVDSGALIDSVPVYMGKMKGATQERPMFIAHETPAYAHTGVKDAVDADGKPVYQQMDASTLVPVMWAEIQSLRARVAALESN